MAELKTYERSIQARDIPLADVTSPSETLINTLRQFSDARMKQAQGVANFNAEQAGQQAGSKLDYEASAPLTETDKVFNDAARQAHQALLHTEIQTQILKAKEQSLDKLSPNSVNLFNNHVEGFSKGLMSQVSPQDEPYVKNLLNYYTTTGHMEVAGAVRGLNKQIALANTLDYLGKTSNSMAEAAYKGDTISAAALFHDTERKVRAMVATGIISGAQAESHIQAARSEINVSNYMGQFQRHLKEGKGAEAYKKFIDSEHPDAAGHTKNLSYLEAETIRSRMHGALQTYNHEQSIKYGSLNKNVGDFVTAATTNLDVDPATLKQKAADLLSGVQEAYANKPQEQQQLTKQIQFGLYAHDIINEAKWTSPQERAAIANQVVQEIQKRGVNLTTEEERNYSALANAVQNIDKQIKSDPAAYVMNHPAVKSAAQTLAVAQTGQQSLTGDPLETAGLPQQSAGKGVAPYNQDPYYSAIQIQKRLGVPDGKISLMTKSEASNFAASISEMGTQDAVKALDAKIAQYPGYENIIERQLSEAVKFPVLAIRTVSQNPETSARLPLLMQAANHSETELKKLVPEDKMLGLKKNVNEYMKTYGEALRNMPGDPTAALNSYTDFATNYAMVLAANGYKDPEKTAVDDLVNKQINIFTINGNVAWVPRNIDTSNAKRATQALMMSLKHEELIVPDYFMPGLQEKRRQELYKEAVAFKGMAATNQNQDGMYLIDENVVPIRTISGGIAEFSFSDLTNPNSKILKPEINDILEAGRKYSLEMPTKRVP
jgi:hypothetical protein